MKKYKASMEVEVKATHYDVIRRMLGDYVCSERIARNNQWIHHFKHGTMMQSYNSVVGVLVRGKTYYGPDHAYSATTDKYIYKWCRRGRKTREAELLSGKARMIVGASGVAYSWGQPWGVRCRSFYDKKDRMV